ncbi:uncharacterized protein C3orf38 homolog isoform X3 [Stegodyphus dumicola]|nr:uncharacterized protein C3orf38 homolog isoform X3 [Stegodyphus dumicola]XP_035204918.1 uncharacterized protein C3orf38 homolog isoform X3 [Stegodyphus dumicola]
MCLEEWHSKEIYKERASHFLEPSVRIWSVLETVDSSGLVANFVWEYKVEAFIIEDSSKIDVMNKESDYEDAEMVYDTNEMDAQQPSKTSLMNAMGREFSKWFFSVYNNIKEFGPEHFWPDCFFKAEVKSPWDHKEVMLSGANDVVIFLSNLILIDKLFFHANVSEDSIICEQEQHGLVKIIVSGVLHRSSDCVGLFDSAFGLVRNPTLDDNWKIKWVYMKLCINTSTKDGLAPEACFPSLCQPV